MIDHILVEKKKRKGECLVRGLLPPPLDLFLLGKYNITTLVPMIGSS